MLVCAGVGEQTKGVLEPVSSLEEDVGVLDDTGPDVAAHACCAGGGEAACQRLRALCHLCRTVRHARHQTTTETRKKKH